jgi:peptide/nickel transport system permease protein
VTQSDQAEAVALLGPDWRQRLSQVRWSRLPWFPILILSVVVLSGIFASLIETHDPLDGDLRRRLIAPFESGHIFGTDQQGRDIFSRLLSGATVSLIVGLAVVGGAGVIGLVVALLSGYYRGWVDQVLSRLTDTFLAIPFLLAAITFVAATGPSTKNLVIILIVFTWTTYARVLRSEVLRVRDSDFVRLAEITGASGTRVMVRHIIPNITNTLIVLVTLQLGQVIIIEAALSFLGLGVPPPQPSWGNMVADGRDFLSVAWWIAVIPSVVIILTVLSVNMLGDWLRTRLDPKFREL